MADNDIVFGREWFDHSLLFIAIQEIRYVNSKGD